MEILNNTVTQSVASLATEDVQWLNKGKQKILVKKLNITTGANTTVNSIKVNGKDIGVTGSVDLVSEFGERIEVNEVIVNASNGGTSAENVEIVLKGVYSY